MVTRHTRGAAAPSLLRASANQCAALLAALNRRSFRGDGAGPNHFENLAEIMTPTGTDAVA